MLSLDGQELSLEQVEHVARHQGQVTLGSKGRSRMEAGQQTLARALADDVAIYGVNTGFGSLSSTRISDAQVRQVQRNLLLSHAAGVGEPLPVDVVRGMLLLLAASLSRGHSGVRPLVVEAVLDLLNAGITPVVPSVGSVGASGDLAPLSHAALVLLGEGEAFVDGVRMAGAEALARAGLAPVVLGPKEGLGLINGTHLMAAEASLALMDLDRVFAAALAAAAMSIDACRGTDAFLDPRVHQARRQRGQIEVAARLQRLIDGSQIIPSHLTGDPRVQDPYSLRCAPQVLGAALDTLRHVRDVVTLELGAVTDNPLVLPDSGPEDRTVVSAGNFHGMPLAIALDTAAIAVAHIGGIAERRVYYMLSASDGQNKLNAHLSPQPGLHSGLMIAQYTAAACCNELITLCAPASVANVPTSAGMEDYNSFGPTAARQLRRAIDLLTSVVAIELLCAAEALEYQRPLRSGDGVERAHATVRQAVARLTQDRPPHPDIEALRALIRAGHFHA